MSGFDGIEQFDGAKCAPSDWTQEGYPGIAHDFDRTKQQRDALNAEHVNLRKQFYALAGAVGWSHERCAQTGDSPLDCAHGLRVQLAAAQDQLAYEIAMHSLTSDVLARERQAKAGLLASHVRVEDLLSDAEKRVRELEAQVLLDTGNIERIREAGFRAEAALAEAQRENKSLREQLAAMVEQPDYSSVPMGPIGATYPQQEPVEITWTAHNGGRTYPVDGNQLVKAKHEDGSISIRFVDDYKRGDWWHEGDDEDSYIVAFQICKAVPINSPSDHPAVAAAVALAVERCAKVCEVGPIPDSVRKFMPEKVEALLALSAAHDKILALAPTLTTEAEAMREDAERYRKACASDTEDK